MENTTIYNEYFTLNKQWKQKYGNKTIVLFQVGSFFEVYAVKNLIANAITEETNTIESFSQMANLKVSQKSNAFYDAAKQQAILMAGFRDYQLDFYVERICENGFTAVVYVQEDNPNCEISKKIRVFSEVFSPGTFLSNNETSSLVKVSNNIMCVWCKSASNRFICGIVIIDMNTGKSNIYEHESQQQYMGKKEENNYDSLERYISMYKPSEVLYIEQGAQDVHNVEPLFGVGVLFHRVDTTTDKIKNVCKQTYVEEILNKQFGKDTYQNCAEFNNYTIATMAFCYLLDFMYEHNRNLVKNIDLPVFNNSLNQVILANHTLKQLNILNDGNGEGHLSSVLSFLNKCTSSIGKRRFKQQLLNPVYCEKWLQQEYDMVNECLLPQNSVMIPFLRNQIKNICDMEKTLRQIAVKRVLPLALYKLYVSLETVQQLNVCLMETPTIQNYLYSREKELSTSLQNMMDFMTSHLNIEKCNVSSPCGAGDEEDFETDCIVNPNVSLELDNLMKEFSSNQQRIKQWRETLTQCLRDANKKKAIDNTQYIKLHKTEKSILSFQITKSRTTTLKEIFKTTKTLTIGDETVETKNIGFSHASGDSNEIDCPQLTTLLKKEFVLKDAIHRVVEKEYKLFLLKLETEWVSFLETVIHYVGKLDVLVCRAYNAMENHYSCPVLHTDRDRDCSQVKTTGLRHILIEHLLTNETYTPNDIELADDPQGILLFGINSSGKTSLLRSLGIAIILAQSGNFVPATTFEYTPYRSIYSRIVGNDNLFKGHSSFAVEMTELRVILRMADQHSLVLADEISKGSEMDSAISITTAALMNFVALKCSFMITSHLHEIVDYDEIKAMSKQLHLKHLLVSFDYEKDTLVYDRTLKDGSGESFYGLLVCKSLHLPQPFIEQAYKIRQKYLVKDKGILSQKTSIYNAKKIRGMCEQCGIRPSAETHHIVPQKLADANGFFSNGLHMNHVANLSALCSSCHDTIHSSVSTVEKDLTSTLTEDSLIKKKKIKIVIKPKSKPT